MVVFLNIDPSDHAIYSAAAGYLARLMGDEAPTVEELLAFEFKHRAVDGLILDYTERVGFDTQELHMMLYGDIWKEGHDELRPDCDAIREKLRRQLPKGD